MRRSVHFRAHLILLLLPLVAVPQPTGLTHQGDRFVREFSGAVPAGRRLRINAHGPVNVQAGAANNISYTVHLSVRARTEAEARIVMRRYNVRVTPRGEWVEITAPGGPVISTVTVKAPRLEQVVVSTSDGAVDAGGIEGSLEVDTRAGEISADRIGGDCSLVTGGGDIRVGTVGGGLRCSSGAGKIQVGTVRGAITAADVGGTVRAETGGGGIHIIKAGGAVTAGNGGGEIVVDSANGIVTVRNMAGPVRVGAAAGVQCETGSGGIDVSNIAGGMRVSTSLGNIMASLLAGKLADSFLATGNGDITVYIPSNVGVNVRAQND